jgi:uncharacterized alkaline shock family protein YloU
MSRVLEHDDRGSVSVTEGVLQQIVTQAVEAVAGARLRKGRRRMALELTGGRAHAELALRVDYGRVLPEIARAVQESVADALIAMCGVSAASVDVAVEEPVR